MCGRFARYTSRKSFTQLAGVQFDAALPFGETLPSWNVTPGRACALVRQPLGGQRELVNLTWGFIPHGAKARPAIRPINARIETVAEMLMFRRVLRYRRALIAADGWFEWSVEDEAKQPYFLCFADRRPFFFGGIWDEWPGPDGLTPTFAILPRPPAPSIAHIHDRQPVIVPPSAYEPWLDKRCDDPAQVRALCDQPATADLIAYRVSRQVNRATADGSELILPIDAASKQ